MLHCYKGAAYVAGIQTDLLFKQIYLTKKSSTTLPKLLDLAMQRSKYMQTRCLAAVHVMACRTGAHMRQRMLHTKPPHPHSYPGTYATSPSRRTALGTKVRLGCRT